MNTLLSLTAIILVSFGTSFNDSRAADIGGIEAALEEAYPDWSVRRAFTAQIIINPLGPWTGGLDTDTGAVNRKLGSDMGEAVTGGGIHFKDLSKADVSVNIVAHMLAQQTGHPVTATCSIGDEDVTFHIGGTGEAFPDNLPAMPDQTLPFADIVERARLYVLTQHGSFEHMAEYGLIA